MRISKHPLAKTLLSLAIASAIPAQSMAASNDQEIDALWQTIEDLQQQISAADEWKNPNTLVHMSGFGSVGYASDIRGMNGGAPQKTNDTFTVGSFSPIFHYQYRDLLMLESELEFQATEAGETEVGMEYFTLDMFLNDHAVLVMGKFLSPLGNFRQNIHPSWVNKLPTPPAGFGHDQAAPNADTGFQVRGGFKLGFADANYAVYMGNGVAAEMNEAGDAVEKVESPGMSVDGDGKKNYGGRLGLFYPSIKLEVGVSWAAGKIPEREIATTLTTDAPIAADGTTANVISLATPITYENMRDWNFVGMDLGYRLDGLNIKAEYVKQDIGALAASGAAGKQTFKATYIQAAYRFLPTKWEVVARTSQYDTPEDTIKRNTVGLNYIFASNIVAKLAFESNDQVDNRTLLQLAYGF